MSGCERNGIGRPTRTVADPAALAVDCRVATSDRTPPPGVRSHPSSLIGARMESWLYVLGFVLLCGVVGAIGGPA